MNHHIIYRQKAIVNVAKESEGYSLQKEISDVIKYELPHLLQDVFDSISANGDIIRIDSLQLDLGVLPAQNTGQFFKERVVEKIREAVIIKKENRTTENGVSVIHKEESLREAFLYFLQHGVKPWYIGNKKKEEWEREMQNAFSKDDWQKIAQWIRQNYKSHPVIIERLVQQFSDDFLEQIILCLISFERDDWKSIYKDLYSLFTANRKTTEAFARLNLLSLCLLTFLEENSLSAALYRIIKRRLESNSEIPLVTDIDYPPEASDNISAPGMATNNIVLTSNIFSRIIDKLKSEESSSLQGHEKQEARGSKNKVKIINEEAKASPFLQQYEKEGEATDNKNKIKIISGDVEESLALQQHEKEKGASLDKTDTKKKNANDQVNKPPSINSDNISGYHSPDSSSIDDYPETADKDSVNEIAKNIISQEEFVKGNNHQFWKNNKPSQDLIEREPQYVSNCGIVLLHPFLEMYFAEFGLLQQKKFIDEDARKRAVLLLHYLATGETEGEEWNLLLHKILCGLSSDETLPNHIDLTEKEKEESKKLLQAVINYCPPLKNTSNAGLRSTFLQRDGRLERKENGWLLTVEQKTVDVLLDKMPWGFSTIKFPWLTEMINVDWC